MSHADFVHLRVHSAFSLAEGALRVPQLVELCRTREMPAVAITDTGNLFGALEFSMAAAKAGIQPIVGCQFALASEPDESRNGFRGGNRPPADDQIVLLAQSEAGYRNLLRIVSRSYVEMADDRNPVVTLAELEGETDGLIALTGGVAGLPGRLIAEGQMDAAKDALLQLKALFPDRLYMELQRHGLEIEDRLEPAFIDLAYEHDIPLLATNEAFFADEGMYEAHDALLCISQSAYVSQSERRRVTSEHRFKSAAEMRALFADLPEAIENTLVVARRCAFMPTETAPMLPPYPTEEGRTEEQELTTEAEAGLEARLVAHVFTEDMDAAAREEAAKPYRDRLRFELETIVNMGYPGYFLIVSDFIKWSKANGVAVGPGRGSGAGSAVAWSLTITDLDPLRFGLFFERFLNPERVSMPDFDIDFCQERRDEVIHYVQQKFGHDRVAQIITFGKLQARAVVRDVGRVLEMPYGQVDRIAKMVPNNPANPMTLQQAIDSEDALKAMRKEDEAVAHLLDLALKLEGLYRNSSTHAAGVVIGDRPLSDIVPLFRDPRSATLSTQFSMKYVEAAGLVKFDFLGLKTLDVLQKAVELLADRDVEVDLATLPLDDEGTFKMLARGDTTGVFQCESSGVRDVLRKLGPDRFEDIIAVVALYRPGPMDNIPSYISRKHGTEEVDYLHDDLEQCLKETYGIPIYQEQVMQMAQELAGYTLGGADLLRRAMGKKIQSEMDAQQETFVAGAAARGVDEATSTRIFETIAKFAGYGFNKAHAAAYALIAYQTAYLKANYPVEFFAASMTLDMGNTDKLAIYKQELARHHIDLLPPDVNLSGVDFTVASINLDAATQQAAAEDDEPVSIGGIHYALSAIKGVGQAAMGDLVQEREANGRFDSPYEVASRLDAHILNRRQLEQLVQAGAFDSLDGNRARTFDSIDQILGHAQAIQRERESGQFSLLGDPGEEGGLPAPEPFDRADWPQPDRLQRELDAVGFYMSAHPLDDYGKLLDRLGVVGSTELEQTVERQGGAANVVLAGSVIAVQQRTSQRGSRYAFVQLSDAAGTFEITMFAEVLAATRELLESGKPVLVQTAARFEEGQLRLTGQSVRELAAAAASAPVAIKIWVEGMESIGSLKTLIDREARPGEGKRGNGRIRLVIPDGEQDVIVRLDGGYLCTPELNRAMRAIHGVVDVQEI
ncbi:MAG: DNA polymerase III subunit alpha [Rhodospirillaceae bacterium]|jgi:DNA polymerase-3 subunit alpha|nr:DNA polymerase III subunit alpha [Rhodospirillaceae bacterium]MBT5359185.1 DNA polymerase III subunit alpha [Rhodospirillaceae bacterium]MBT5769055.1 DNA polymerase III subunit alpha [Rhodospirillaceae bacterium]MBT6310594.1 DNA polymerase III subunit alpha [Rhodospirillaceae bacterium]MBT7364736.1 DNA polymerase III subunit alpha [Rhodospirillaceae bacterium]